MTVTDDQIRRIFMEHGFTIKAGCDDLKPYVYAAARALIDEVLALRDETVIYGAGFHDGHTRGRSEGLNAAMQQVEEQRGDALLVPREVLELLEEAAVELEAFSGIDKLVCRCCGEVSPCANESHGDGCAVVVAQRLLAVGER